MIVKCGRREFKLEQRDIIMFNGACYQIITQLYKQGFDSFSPVIALARAKKLISLGELVLYKTTGSSEDRNKLEYYKIKERM